MIQKETIASKSTRFQECRRYGREVVICNCVRRAPLKGISVFWRAKREEELDGGVVLVEAERYGDLLRRWA